MERNCKETLRILLMKEKQGIRLKICLELEKGRLW